MRNELSKAVTKLLQSEKHTLQVIVANDDSVKCSGIFEGHLIEIYASIRRSTFYDLCKTPTEDKPNGHISISVDSAQAVASDIYGSDDIEYMKDQIYYLIKKLREIALKRGEAYDFLMDTIES